MFHIVRDKRLGFTLIEVLLAISVIGILTAILTASVSGSQAKGRDTARIADLERIDLAMMRYYETCREYPATLTTSASNGCSSGTTLGSFLPSIPIDPLGASYTYSTSGAGNGYDGYLLRTELEATHTVLEDDIDGSSHDGATLDCDDSPQFYYCLGS